MRKEILWPSCPALIGFYACLGYNKPQLLELTSLWQKGPDSWDSFKKEGMDHQCPILCWV